MFFTTLIVGILRLLKLSSPVLAKNLGPWIPFLFACGRLLCVLGGHLAQLRRDVAENDSSNAWGLRLLSISYKAKFLSRKGLEFLGPLFYTTRKITY